MGNGGDGRWGGALAGGAMKGGVEKSPNEDEGRPAGTETASPSPWGTQGAAIDEKTVAPFSEDDK